MSLLKAKQNWWKILLFSLAHPLDLFVSVIVMFSLSQVPRLGSLAYGYAGPGNGLPATIFTAPLYITILFLLYPLLVALKYQKFKGVVAERGLTTDDFLRAHFLSQWPYLVFLPATYFVAYGYGGFDEAYAFLFWPYLAVWVAAGIISMVIFRKGLKRQPGATVGRPDNQ